MRLLRQAKHAVSRLRRDGLLLTARYTTERASEWYHEWRLGISSTGKRTRDELGIESPFSCHYYPSDYRSIYRAFRHLTIRANEDVFLDFGSGMGRVVVVAGTFPFRKVIGVELSPELSATARENVNRARAKLRCLDIQIATNDAASYPIPPDVTVIFFYNPFQGPVLSRVLNNIRESLVQSPRDLWIVFKNPIDLRSRPGLDSWLTTRHEFTASDAEHTIVILNSRRLRTEQG